MTGVTPQLFALYTGLKAPVQAGQKYQSLCARVKLYATKNGAAKPAAPTAAAAMPTAPTAAATGR
jgi:hypothetical protein